MKVGTKGGETRAGRHNTLLSLRTCNWSMMISSFALEITKRVEWSCPPEGKGSSSWILASYITRQFR